VGTGPGRTAHYDHHDDRHPDAGTNEEEHMVETVLVTGGAGYIGAPLCEELLAKGMKVRALDVLLHGQRDIADDLRSKGVTFVEGDITDESARAEALQGADAVVHLAAIVGDPACALDPELSEEVNVKASHDLIDQATKAGVRRWIMASTCSNYGRMADPTVPITEEGELSPVSLYARQKVGVEQRLMTEDFGQMIPTCLRFATVYGVAQRMRFDLTVNEFTRDLWADKDLEVFGEQFWRPYVHVKDAGRGVVAALTADTDVAGKQVFNVGRSGENYRKLDLVEEIGKQTDKGKVSYVKRDEDPRDYKVSFDKIREVLGFETLMTVPDGIGEILAGLDEDVFGDPFDGRYKNIP